MVAGTEIAEVVATAHTEKRGSQVLENVFAIHKISGATEGTKWGV